VFGELLLQLSDVSAGSFQLAREVLNPENGPYASEELGQMERLDDEIIRLGVGGLRQALPKGYAIPRSRGTLPPAEEVTRGSGS